MFVASGVTCKAVSVCSCPFYFRPASVPLPHPAHHCPAQESHPGAEPLAGKVPGCAHCVVELGWEQQGGSHASGLSQVPRSVQGPRGL